LFIPDRLGFRTAVLICMLFMGVFAYCSDAPLSIAEHSDITWQMLGGAMALIGVLVGLLYRQAMLRIKGVEEGLKNAIKEIKDGCTAAQNNCPKTSVLAEIRETLRQVNSTLATTSETINRIFERQDKLRDELPKEYVPRVEYESRHKVVTEMVQHGLEAINAQLTDLTKTVSNLEGMRALTLLLKQKD